MDFLHDPVGQLLINVFVALIIGVAAVITSIVIYRKQRSRKALAYRIISNSIILPKIDVGENAKDRLQFTFDGKPVSDASTLRQKNIHDKIGGKSKEEESIDAKASYSGRPE